MPSNAAMAGWFAGAVQVVAEQPFDVVKVRLQSRAISFVAEPGALSLARSTFLREGATGAGARRRVPERATGVGGPPGLVGRRARAKYTYLRNAANGP